MLVRISVNTSHRGKHPAHLKGKALKSWFRPFNGRFNEQLLYMGELTHLIRMGYAIAPICQGYRKAENFVCAQHVALDFDNGRYTLNELTKHPLIQSYGAFVHTTASHTEAHPKLRAVFILDRPIHNPDKYALLVRSIMWRFGDADPTCKDPVRFFYGSPDCQLVKTWRTLRLEDCATVFVRPYQEMVAERERREAVQPVTPSESVSNRRLVGKADALLNRITTAPDGQKWHTLRSVAYTFGGYVAGGYYTREQAVTWCKTAIQTRKNEVRDMSLAFKTIESGVNAGMKRPLQISERRPRTSRATNWRQLVLNN